LFAALISTFVIASFFGLYSEFVILNGAEIDEPYQSAFEDIASQYSGLETISNTAKDEGLVKNILDFGKNAITGTVNVFIVGLDAIGTFFQMVPIIGNIFSVLSNVFPGLGGLIGLLTIIMGVYVAMRYIQSASNKNDLP